MIPDTASLRAIFREEVERAIDEGHGCPPGLDFDAPRPGLAPGNLWDPPSEWQSTQRRGPIPAPGCRAEEHPRFAELMESFVAADYVRLNPDLQGVVSESWAMEHFLEHGYAERRPFSGAIWSCVDTRYYAARHELTSLDEAGLRAHYGYVGRYEDRFPNDLTEFLADCPVHLWQMGKVGSMSIARALREQHGRNSVHLHYVDAWHRSLPSVGVHYSRLLHHHGVGPKRVVCGVRDPVERVVSGYFQEAESRGDAENVFHDAREATRQLALRMVSDVWFVCGWFEHRFFAGFDVYAEAFDPGRGFLRGRAGDTEVFIYRQDRLGELEAELADFLDVPGLTLLRANVSARKPYREQFAILKDCIELPDHLRDRIYSSRYAKVFGFEQSWNRTRPGVSA